MASFRNKTRLLGGHAATAFGEEPVATIVCFVASLVYWAPSAERPT